MGVGFCRHRQCSQQAAPKPTPLPDPHGHTAGQAGDPTDPRVTLSRLSTRIGLPRSTVHLALRRQLGLFPYKLQLVQRLCRGDKYKRLRVCQWLLSRRKSCAFRKGFLMSDEAVFHFDGSITRRNCRAWGTEPPHEVTYRPEQPPHVTVWCGVASLE